MANSRELPTYGAISLSAIFIPAAVAAGHRRSFRRDDDCSRSNIMFIASKTISRQQAPQGLAVDGVRHALIGTT